MAATYRDRIGAFYAKYCPDKPLSHVDYLLAKYVGHEEDIIDVLKEKYGPEPALPMVGYEQRVASLLQSAATGHSQTNSVGSSGHGRGPGGLSPVDRATQHLLERFAGVEDVLMEGLSNRYGSEPRLRLDADDYMRGDESGRRNGGGGLGNSSIDARTRAIPSNDAEFEAALQSRRAVFDRDMRSVHAEKEQQRALEALQAVSEAKVTLQHQEVEIQQLRLALSALQMQTTANEQALSTSIQHVAQQLTQAKLRHLTLASTLNPRVVAASELKQVLQTTADTEREMQRTVGYCQKLAAVVRRHLLLFPLTPMHGALRQLDPALCARLDQ
mgnify:FL=1